MGFNWGLVDKKKKTRRKETGLRRKASGWAKVDERLRKKCEFCSRKLRFSILKEKPVQEIG